RTFGTDLPLVARVISEFAKGNHPLYPNYFNSELILNEDGLFCSRWRYKEDGNEEEKELIYELHPMMMSQNNSNSGSSGSSSNSTSHSTHCSGDDEVLNYLQSKTIVGIQDNYPFWRDANHEPWAGKPVWARTNNNNKNGQQGGSSTTNHNHHHILLDDNIHNDPKDGAGGIRIPVVKLGCCGNRDGVGHDDDNDTASYYESLHGIEALAMHGKHLIRVPTIRPLMEDDWFIRQIEGARWRLLMEEAEEEEGEMVVRQRNKR
ncbi:hypothetical protein N9140_00730, partial [bacterium]|nr:hypothetical protein [bacterium]